MLEKIKGFKRSAHSLHTLEGFPQPTRVSGSPTKLPAYQCALKVTLAADN